MNRRSFLKTLAVSSAAATFPSIVRAQALGLGDTTAPSVRLNIGCIGTGIQGRANLTNALANSSVRVVAVCDVDKKHREQAHRMVEETYAREKRSGTYKGCAEYDDMRELLARPDIDAVLIATPEHWHALNVIYAARAGKHIYCEKPAGASIPETRAMLNAVQFAGVVCQIGSQQRSSTDFLRVIDLTRGGYLGAIKRVRVGLPSDMNKRPAQAVPGMPEPVPPELDYETWLGPAGPLPYCKARVHYNWRWNFAFGGGRLTDWVGHHFDSAALAMRVSNMMPIAIREAKARFLDDSPLYNTAADYSFEAHYANGIVIEVSSALREGVHIDGSEGSVYVNRGIVEYSAPHLRRIQIPTQRLSLSQSGPRGHMNDFVECALSGARPRAPMSDAHCVTAAAHLANVAFRAGRRELRFDPVVEQLVDAPDAVRYFQRTMRAPWTLDA
ncbi:Gfo/Idh/MocA family oxidoreductase [Termitidicoccus mucosus]